MGIATYPGIEVGQWIAPTLLNGWANYGGGWAPAGYLLDSTGFVWIRGLVTKASGAISAIVFTLPVECRPPVNIWIQSVSANASPEGEVRVTTAGDVGFNALGGSLVWYSMSGVRFHP